MTSTTQNPATDNFQTFRWNLSFASGYLALGMFRQAESELKKIPLEYREHPDALSLRGRVLLARNKWRSVISNAHTGRELYPDNADFFVQEAVAYDQMNRPLEAKLIWLAAPDLVRKSGYFHYNLARCEAKLGNIPSAREHLSQALSLDPNIRSLLAADGQLVALIESAGKN